MPIKDSDVKIRFFRASGPGGQHRNKTASAVRLTHLPTGIVVEAREERDQHKNRAVAMRRLEDRLRGLAEARRARDKAEAHRTKPPASFGHFRRTYRLVHPAGVTDASGHFEADIDAVLDGDIDGFLTPGSK